MDPDIDDFDLILCMWLLKCGNTNKDTPSEKINITLTFISLMNLKYF